jgi:subtilisin family serine protease
MDPAQLQKLDTGLSIAVRAYEESRGTGDADAAISVNLRFEGDLAAIEALGFEAHSVAEDQALGVIRLRDVARVAAHPNVIRISAGVEPSLYLDTAVSDGRARASSTATVGAGGDGLWHAVAATGALTAGANATGKDVIVAVIDTGIDFTHPTFMSQITPTKKTRIKRIWDQGLPPGSIAECPDVALLASANTYGVEYKNDPPPNDQIDAALSGGPPVLHKDCEGHGTHVAAIAAGGVFFPAGGDAKFVGVAPEADIIAVKLLDVPDSIKFRLAAGFGAEVSFATRFRDAVIYCLRTARAMGKPVVINMSFGADSEAGDGLDDDARWVDARMDPAQPPGPLNFPTGAIVVKAAGNSGDAARQQVAKITVPAAGQITVPLELKDDRVGVNTKFKNCAETLHKQAVRADFWYRRNFDVVRFALRLPNQAAFSADMGIGGFLDQSFILRFGPPRIAFVASAANVHRVFASHGTEASVPHPAGGSLRRHDFDVILLPKVSAGTVTYAEGIYEVRIKAPAGTEIFLMCGVVGFAPGKSVKFRVASTMADGVTAPDPNIVLTSEFSATDTLGQYVITVAAYNDTDGVAADPVHHHIAAFSSRGPLRDFSDPPGSKPLIATKPDVAAPGVKIKAAESADTKARPLVPTAAWLDGVRFVEKNGTSMAAPFISGVVALMLDKKSDLTITQARAALTTGAAGRPGANPSPPGAAHTNAYGSGMVDALQTHLSTP